jgi:hypothetical protein
MWLMTRHAARDNSRIMNNCHSHEFTRDFRAPQHDIFRARAPRPKRSTLLDGQSPDVCVALELKQSRGPSIQTAGLLVRQMASRQERRKAERDAAKRASAEAGAAGARGATAARANPNVNPVGDWTTQAEYAYVGPGGYCHAPHVIGCDGELNR